MSENENSEISKRESLRRELNSNIDKLVDFRLYNDTPCKRPHLQIRLYTPYHPHGIRLQYYVVSHVIPRYLKNIQNLSITKDSQKPIWRWQITNKQKKSGINSNRKWRTPQYGFNQQQSKQFGNFITPTSENFTILIFKLWEVFAVHLSNICRRPFDYYHTYDA